MKDSSVIHGHVIPGHNRGAVIGFPTINIETFDPLPKHGIYAGFVELDNTTYKAAIHIGPVPAFGDKEVSVEAHLIGYSGTAYGKHVTMTCTEKIRDVMDFRDVTALQHQIELDVEKVNKLLS